LIPLGVRAALPLVDVSPSEVDDEDATAAEVDAETDTAPEATGVVTGVVTDAAGKAMVALTEIADVTADTALIATTLASSIEDEPPPVACPISKIQTSINNLPEQYPREMRPNRLIQQKSSLPCSLILCFAHALLCR
jgi:hypothetical protein